MRADPWEFDVENTTTAPLMQQGQTQYIIRSK